LPASLAQYTLSDIRLCSAEYSSEACARRNEIKLVCALDAKLERHPVQFLIHESEGAEVIPGFGRCLIGDNAGVIGQSKVAFAEEEIQIALTSLRVKIATLDYLREEPRHPAIHEYLPVDLVCGSSLLQNPDLRVDPRVS